MLYAGEHILNPAIIGYTVVHYVRRHDRNVKLGTKRCELFAILFVLRQLVMIELEKKVALAERLAKHIGMGFHGGNVPGQDTALERSSRQGNKPTGVVREPVICDARLALGIMLKCIGQKKAKIAIA